MKTCRVPVIAVALLAATPSAEWQYATANFTWDFPRDHWSHDGFKTEWWYVTGHLQPVGRDSVRFGYQFTFFRVGLLEEAPSLPSAWASANLIMGHAALTDLQTGEHRFTEVLYRETPFLGGFPDYPDSVIAWSRAPAGTDGVWRISWNGSAFDLTMGDQLTGIGLSLTTRPVKSRIFHGPNGYSRRSAEDPRNASMYYSFPRLWTTGTVTIDGRRFDVAGESWMDKEFGSNQLADNQVGWDWFSLQLADGRDLMLYRLRNADGSQSYRHATLVDEDGSTRFLDDSEWAIEPGARWTSPETGATYPLEWTVTADVLSTPLRVRPLLRAQENVSASVPNLYYWEGAVIVVDEDGTQRGRGYLELTGYGQGSRPAI